MKAPLTGASQNEGGMMDGQIKPTQPPTDQAARRHKRASRHVRPTDARTLRLTERDKEVVKAVNDYRLMRQDQIQRLLFPSRNTAQRRLRLLWEHGYLRRRFLPVLGGVQTSPILYEVDRRGVELLRTEFHYQEVDLRYVK